MIYELLKKQVQQNTAFLNVYGRAKKQKKNEVTTNSFGTKLTKIIEFPLYDGTPLVPNANKKDLVFFERVGNVRDISDSYYSVLEEDFKVIVWLNKDTFDVSGKTYNGDIDIIVKELNRALISNKNSYILSIEFEDATDENVFSSYTFSEAENAMTIEPFSAFELNYKIKYLASCNNLDSNIVVLNSECEPVGNQSNGKIYVGDTEVTIKNTTGETLYFESIPATQDREFQIQNSIYRVYNPEGKLLAEGEIPAEGVEEITVSLGFDDLPRIVNTEDKDVGHENDVKWIVEDSTVIIKNTEDTELYSVDVPAEDSREQTINDSQAIIKDSSGSTLKSENILAEGSKDITIQDSEVDVKNTTGATLYSESILAEGSKDITIQDSEVEIKNSAGTTLYSENIPAEENEELTIQDSTAIIKDTDNNTLYTENILAEGSKDITIQDSTFTVKNSENNILKQDNILAQGSGEYTVQDSEVVIKDKFGNIIEQEDIPAEGSKEFTVNTELPVKNTTGQDVGQEINGEIIVGDSNIKIKDSEDNVLIDFDVPAENNGEKVINDSTAIIKDSEGNTLKSESILAEGSKDITITDSTSTIKDSSGADLYVDSIVAQGSNTRTILDSTNVIKDSAGTTLYNESILAEGSKDTTIQDSQVTIKDATGATITTTNVLAESSKNVQIQMQKSPLILKFDTTLTGNANIELARIRDSVLDIKIYDENGYLVWEQDNLTANSGNDLIISDLTIGIYTLEIFAHEFMTLQMYNSDNKEALVELVQWGDVVWRDQIDRLFQSCTNLRITANDRMLFTDTVSNLEFYYSFANISEITNNNWMRYIPFNLVEGGIYNMFVQTSLPKKVVLDFKDASGITNVSNMFGRYQGLGGVMEEIHILNMGDTEDATGNILGSVNNFPNLKTVILEDLQLSTNLRYWIEGDAEDYITFFENIGDRTGKDQRTITIRTTDWDKLDANQKDYVDNILNDRNWALA